MITLVVFICSIASGNCIINTPHKRPYFVPPFETIKDCTDEGNRAKQNLTKTYDAYDDPAEIKFRCIRWNPTI